MSPEGDTALLAACRNGHLQTALCLLSHGASANQVDKDGRTALHVSCRHGKEAVAEALILGGADVSVRDHGGKQLSCYDWNTTLAVSHRTASISELLENVMSAPKGL